MTEEDAWVASLNADPSAVGVYSDWLEDRGLPFEGWRALSYLPDQGLVRVKFASGQEGWQIVTPWYQGDQNIARTPFWALEAAAWAYTKRS